MSMNSLIFDRLNGDATVEPIVGEKISEGRPKQGIKGEFIVYRRDGGAPVKSIGHDPGDTKATYLVDCFADTTTDVDTLADAVRASLLGWRDLNLSPKVESWLLEDERNLDQEIRPGSDIWKRRRTQEYSVWFDDT